MKKTQIKIGIIAGTPFDTKLGALKLKQLGYKTLQYFISSSPEEQTLLQENPTQLTHLVSHAISQLTHLGVTKVIIYCHSMSLCIDFNSLKEKHNCSIYSPIDVLEQLHITDTYIGLISANSIAVKKTEDIIKKYNPNCEIIGIGLMPLVKTIECTYNQELIISKHGLIDLCNFFFKNKCRNLILGCTHLEIIHSTLSKQLIKNKIPITLIPLYELTINQLQVNTITHQ